MAEYSYTWQPLYATVSNRLTQPTLAMNVGYRGPAGVGVPTGGEAGEFLQKQSGSDYDADWVPLDTEITTATATDLDGLLAGDGSTVYSLPLTTYQPLDSDLTAIAALSTTSFGRALLTLASAAAGRSALELGSLAVLSPTGTAKAATFLRGDGSWQAPPDTVSTSTTTAINALLAGNGSTVYAVTLGSGFSLSGGTLTYTESSGGGGTWGSITGTLSSQADLQAALNARAVLASANTFTVGQTIATTGGYPTYPLTVTHAGLDVLNTAVVAGTGVIWSAHPGFGALNIRSDTIRLQKFDGTNQLVLVDSSAWTDMISTAYLQTGTQDGFVLMRASGGNWTRFQLRSQSVQISSANPQFSTVVPVGMFEVINDTTTKPTARLQAVSGQTADAMQVANSSGTAVAGFAVNGGIKLAELSDAAASNSTLYYSTTASRLVYKDSGGTVNNLY